MICIERTPSYEDVLFIYFIINKNYAAFCHIIVEKKKLIFSSKRSRIVNGASVRIILRQVIMHKGKGKRMAWYEEVVFYHIYPLGLLGAPEYTHCPEYHRSITDQTMED